MKQIKANELMLGDWVQYRISEHRQSMPMQVCLISESEVYLTFEGNEADPWIITEDELLPIPLTAEILERNGFRNTDDHTLKGADTYNLDIEYRGYDFRVTIKRNDYFAVDTYDDRVYRLVEMHTGKWNVHELQHALKLCGIDKEIKI